MNKRLGRVLLLLVCAVLIAPLASAQNLIQAALSIPDTGSFPTVRAFLDLRDDQGNFISGLQMRELTVIENSQEF